MSTTNDLIFHLALNALSGDQVLDVSGNGYNGTLGGDAQIIDDDTFGHCLSLDGDGDYVALDTFFYDTVTSFPEVTVEAWIKTNSADDQIIASFDRNATWRLEINGNGAGDGQVGWCVWTDEGQLELGTDARVDDGAWHHVAGVYDHGAATIYIDGMVAATANMGTTFAGTPSDGEDRYGFIGVGSEAITFDGDKSPEWYFNGQIAHVRVYHRALTADEIGQDMQNDLSGLLFYLPLTEVTLDGQVLDTSGNAIDGTLLGNTDIVADPAFGQCLSFDGAGDYVALDTFFYDTVTSFPEVTVEAWIKTNSAGDQIIASFDRNATWRLEINGNGAGDGQVGWCVKTDAGQIDLGTETRVDDGAWHHVAGVYDHGAATIYIDGMVAAITSKGAMFGGHTTDGEDRYGFIGVGSEAITFDGDKSPEWYFNGQIAHVRVYHRALTADEIALDMDRDQTAAASFQSSHPLDFGLYDDDHQPVLYIVDDPAGTSAHLDISNTSNHTVTLADLGDTASEDNYHFELRFRPGTLNGSSVTVLEESDWSIDQKKNDADGTDSLYLLKKMATDETTLDPGGKFALTLQQIVVDGTGGTRGTRVEFKYPDLTYEGDDVPLNGYRVEHISLVNHRGSENIPLHVGFVGTNTILNNGDVNLSLTLDIVNVSTEDTISLTPTGQEGASQLVISFDTEPAGETIEWALCTTDESTSAGLNLPVDWHQREESMGQTVEWILETEQTALAPGEHLHIELTGLQSTLPAGFAHLYVNYIDIPGYWDGQFVCTVEKTPIVHHGDNVGIGVAAPQARLDVYSGTGRALNAISNSNSKATIYAKNEGTSNTIYAHGNSDDYPTIYAKNQGSNNTIYAETAGEYPTIYVENTGTGRAIRATNNADNSATISAKNEGGANTIYAENTGGGRAIRATNNADNSATISAKNEGSANTIYAENTSTGRAIYAKNNSDDHSTIHVTNEGSDNALYAESNGTDSTILVKNTGGGRAIHAENNDDNHAAIRADNSHSDGYDFYAGGNKHYGNASSIRLKKNIRPLEEALDKVLQLNGVYFTWKAGDVEDLGFIAEEVGKVIPEAVTYEEDGEYASGMSYNHLVPVLVEAVKEQQTIIDQQAETIDALTQRLDRLEALLAARNGTAA